VDLLGWMGRTFARFVGFVLVILSGWMFFVNVIEVHYEPWVMVWIWVAGLAGAIGGIVFLLSFDGPERFKKQRIRYRGWVGMMVGALFPTSLTLMVLPMVVFVSPLWPYLRLASEPSSSE